MLRFNNIKLNNRQWWNGPLLSPNHNQQGIVWLRHYREVLSRAFIQFKYFHSFVAQYNHCCQLKLLRKWFSWSDLIKDWQQWQLHVLWIPLKWPWLYRRSHFMSSTCYFLGTDHVENRYILPNINQKVLFVNFCKIKTLILTLFHRKFLKPEKRTPFVPNRFMYWMQRIVQLLRIVDGLSF